MKPITVLILLIALSNNWWKENKDYVQTEIKRVAVQQHEARLASKKRFASMSSRLGIKPRVMVATAYEPSPISCGYWARFHRTFTGIRPHRGVIAVDPKVIPLHSKLYVEGYGYAVAEDTGGAIKGNRIDLFMDTYHEAIHFGRKPVKVWVLRWGKDKSLQAVNKMAKKRQQWYDTISVEVNS